MERGNDYSLKTNQRTKEEKKTKNHHKYAKYFLWIEISKNKTAQKWIWNYISFCSPVFLRFFFTIERARARACVWYNWKAFDSNLFQLHLHGSGDACNNIGDDLQNVLGPTKFQQPKKKRKPNNTRFQLNRMVKKTNEETSSQINDIAETKRRKKLQSN